MKSLYPGYLLCRDTFHVGALKEAERLYLQAVVDTYGSCAFAKLHTSGIAVTPADIPNDRVLPFCFDGGTAIEAVLADNGKEYRGKPDEHSCEPFPALNDIEHRFTRVAAPGTGGFVERFRGTALDEFFGEAFGKKFCASVDELQADLDERLHHCNHERPRRGHRNKKKNRARPLPPARKRSERPGKRRTAGRG